LYRLISVLSQIQLKRLNQYTVTSAKQKSRIKDRIGRSLVARQIGMVY